MNVIKAITRNGMSVDRLFFYTESLKIIKFFMRYVAISISKHSAVICHEQAVRNEVQMPSDPIIFYGNRTGCERIVLLASEFISFSFRTFLELSCNVIRHFN